MASDGPDPQSLGSWQDAFQYPIPTVRRVEQELRRDVASNKEKLRALVGTRYRELVGTAETIVSMNREMAEVDSNLAEIGRRCNPRLMGKQYAHFRQVNGDKDEQDATKRALGAQLALLHRLCMLMSKLLRRRSSPLLTAKLFVVSRLLHKTLSEQKSAPPFLETLRNQLALLRRTLRSRIDKRLASAKSSADEIIEALAAYCLATSSSSDDAIAYFHKIRLEVIGSRLSSAEISGGNILAALRIYIGTLQTSKTLLSRRFSDVLNKLKARPLLADTEIRSMDDLDLDVLGRWLATDLTNFTPWIKLSELSKQDAERTIKKWSKVAFESFVEHCQGTLANWEDFSTLISLRQETMEFWICSWTSTLTHSPLQVLEGIRNVFNKRLAELLSNSVKTLQDVGQSAAHAITTWANENHTGSQSLWDYELVTLDYSNGAATFKESITNRLLGADQDTASVLGHYQTWLTSIGKFKDYINELRQVRWPDNLDETADDDLEIDIASILNEDDPQLLWEVLGSAIKEALEALQASFDATFESIGDANKSSKAAFMLKLVRLVRRDLPREFVAGELEFSRDIIPRLQEMLATEVVAHTHLPNFTALPQCRARKLPGRTLWEGDPELPVQPSPSTFKYIRRIVKAMDQYGPGLWDMSTVYILKTIIQRKLAESADSCLEKLNTSNVDSNMESKSEPTSPVQNGDPRSSDSGNEVDITQDCKLQLYFDAVFLGYALAGKDLEQNHMLKFAERLRGSLGSGSEKTIKTMDRRAQEYWHRTQLLFGLLVGDLE